jgi:hypothetical protein
MSTSQLIPDSMLPVIQKALSDLDTAEKELELARRAGLFNTPAGAQLSGLVQQVTDSRTALMNIKQVYFPGQ